MNKLSSKNSLTKIVIAFSLLGVSQISLALPFTIVPSGTLPTSVSKNGSVNASYKITNNTASTRMNNHVRYLPPNVVQTVDNQPGTCTTSFTLSAKGTVNDNCILKLKISGAVDKNDPNPYHHLFVCFPGDVTCAGTAYPLNVHVSFISFSCSRQIYGYE
ncbi:MAG: hypothetical protein PSV35_05030 [bacterium]|nr:hypothetical protein [bacterium]